MKILALDIATRTGVAVGSPGCAPRAWVENLGKPPDDKRFARLLNRTSALIAEHKPDLVAVEGPVGGAKASPYLIGLVACVRGVCALRSVQSEAVNIGTIRKHFLGKAYTARDFPGLTHAKAKRQIKALVMDRCALLGWSVQDDNEADAIALWDYAQATWARGYQAAPSGNLFTG